MRVPAAGPAVASSAEMRTGLDAAEVQPTERASFMVADPDDDAGQPDAAAGCEFVDDRIRVRE